MAGVNPGWLASPAVTVQDYAQVTVTLHIKITTIVGPAVTTVVVLKGDNFDADRMFSERLFAKEISTPDGDAETDGVWTIVEMEVGVADASTIVVGCLAPAEAAGGQVRSKILRHLGNSRTLMGCYHGSPVTSVQGVTYQWPSQVQQDAT